MKNKELLILKQKAKRLKKNQRDARFLKTMGFLKSKKLLGSNLDIPYSRNIKLSVEDALWSAKNVEPRILEVLPAAILHFPKSIIGYESTTDELKEIVKLIKKNEARGPDYNGIEYKKMRFWANQELNDKRTRPQNEKKKMVSFRLKPKVLMMLESIKRKKGFETNTDVFEYLVEEYKI